ncbi:MAG: GlcNAc-PI de-N-acetylase [Chloroflexi bacterium]|nr:GlcNAc-PI de-N-acetylase [Chloroflexi bacterium CFX1]MCK6567705.1 PIG-L family deacetylase [Anaerolineales bacterium]MCQ3954105.1 GlcNAc-PI de-N-acetylase [Chloroflexota bacterium]MDL1918322.1 GlcNAc-PI de-N-acetylase [Chloroflexi bacterium CFX5]NUQ58807.1 PIG-L family deacetylase [Anaerolineales bacterium]
MTKRILAVLAHPDDESFGLGGTLALYAKRGYETYYVCATRGEAGSADEEHMKGFKDTAEMRTAELMRAAKELGLKEVIFLGYRDSGMPGMEANNHPDAQINHPVEEVAGRVVRHIRAIRPDVVITFDPIGGYKHPDHIHIHKATVLAFANADDENFYPEHGAGFKPTALYFQIFPRWFLRVMTRLMPLFGKDPKKWGRNGDINLKELAEVNFPVHVRLNIRSVSAIKRRAGEQHASQGGIQMRRGLMGFVTKVFGEREEFMRAYPPVTGEFKRRTDLFDI